ncbi:hypothetical protein Tco_0497716 [Tanacetum coccineum]
MGDANPIRTLGDYSEPSHEGYRNTIELREGNNVSDPRDFGKMVKAISLPQDIPSTSDRRLIELEHQVQRLMEAHIAPMQPTQVNKITSSCEICSRPHDTQYCMENPEQAFVEYASSCINEAGGLVSNFMSSQDARLSKFKADFKQQQSKMTNKIDTLSKTITDRMARALPSDTVKNSILNLGSTSLVLAARSYPTEIPAVLNSHPRVNQHHHNSSMNSYKEIAYIIACRKFFKENEKKIFSEAGDGVRIYPDGVIIFNKKKLGSS